MIRLILLAVFLAAVSLHLKTAFADTIHVPKDYPTIQGAIDSATDGDEIIVGPGRYFENINLLGKAVTLRSSAGPEVTTIDANGSGGTVIRCISGEGGDTVLSGFTITGGFRTSGAGMRIENSSPTVHDCVFEGNEAIAVGGGMENDGSSPIVNNCTFSGNSARHGAGMFNHDSNPTVTGCTFSGNTAASYSGGMYNINSSPTVTGCTFSGNTAFNHGGGMRNLDNSNPRVTRCTFNGNSARSGGGMANDDSEPTVINCTFSGNTALELGGGMFNIGPYSTPRVINCTFSGNTAQVRGGGMNNLFKSSPTVTNCVLWGNVDDADGNAGGPFTDESAQIHLGAGASANVTYTLIQGLDSFSEGAGNIDGDPLFVDSGFWDKNGTPGSPDDDFWVEGDYHVLPGSPCIDAGDNTAVPNEIMTDLDGNPRFVNNLDAQDTGLSEGGCPIIDIGAYESQDGTVECCGNCPTDGDDDSETGAFDLATLLVAWGPVEGLNCLDADGNGSIDAFDLAILLGAWGPCE